MRRRARPARPICNPAIRASASRKWFSCPPRPGKRARHTVSETVSGRLVTWLRRALAVFAALVLFLLAVVAVNQEQITLRFLAWQSPALSVFWWLLIALLLGLSLGLAGALGMSARRSLRSRRMRKELQAANAELQRLRESAPPQEPAASHRQASGGGS